MRRAALGIVLSTSTVAWAAPVPVDEQAVLQFLQTHPDFLNQHPEVVERAQEYRRWRQIVDESMAVDAALAASQSLLDSPLVGRAGTGRLLIVEFVDHVCPPCRASMPALEDLLARDPDVRVVYLPYPLFGQEAELAARAALSAQLQGRFASMHSALMEAPVIDRRSVVAMAQYAGLDVDKLLTDLADPRYETVFEQTKALARTLKVDGAPAFVVGGLLIEGGTDTDRLGRAVLLARCLARRDERATTHGSDCLEQTR